MRCSQICAYGNKLRHAPTLASHIPGLYIGLGTRLAKSGHMTLGTPPSGRRWIDRVCQEPGLERVKAAKQNDGEHFDSVSVNCEGLYRVKHTPAPG